MRPLSTVSALAWLGGFQALPVNAIQTISAVGSKFFHEDGTQYFLKGEPPGRIECTIYTNLVQSA